MLHEGIPEGIGSKTKSYSQTVVGMNPDVHGSVEPSISRYLVTLYPLFLSYFLFPADSYWSGGSHDLVVTVQDHQN